MVDNHVPSASANGEFDAELVWISYALWPTLQALTGRQLVPIPREIKGYERVTFGKGLGDRLKRWVRRCLRGCATFEDAATVQQLKTALDAQFGSLSDVQLATVGLGRSMRIRRSGANAKTYYKLSGLRCPGMHVEATKSRQFVRLATQPELVLAVQELASDSD